MVKHQPFDLTCLETVHYTRHEEIREVLSEKMFAMVDAPKAKKLCGGPGFLEA